MPNQYLIEIHRYISDKVMSVEERLKAADTLNDLPEKKFYDGQLQELTALRQYLANHINLKTQRYY